MTEDRNLSLPPETSGSIAGGRRRGDRGSQRQCFARNGPPDAELAVAVAVTEDRNPLQTPEGYKAAMLAVAVAVTEDRNDGITIYNALAARLWRSPSR